MSELTRGFQNLGIRNKKRVHPQQQGQPELKRLKHQKSLSQKTVDYQQYMVPFLFQQSISKRFDRLDLFYYDEEWSPVRQSRSSITASLQDQFPGLHQVQKDSSSAAVIYRGTHKGRKVFVKSFTCGRNPAEFDALDDDTKALSYEKEVYRRIRSASEGDDEVRRHFIQMLFCAKDARNGVAYIFSQDAGGRSLKEYFATEPLTFPFLVGVMTQYLYLLHLLHDKLHIVHNDLHAGNLIVVRDKQPQKTCTFGGQTFRLKDHPYTLMVYDFDYSSMFEPLTWRNPFIQHNCDRYGRCPDYPATDFYTYLIILLYYSAPDRFKDTRDEVLHNLLLVAYQFQMPDDLYDHMEKVSDYFHYAPCVNVPPVKNDATWKCRLPKTYLPTLPQLARLWHDALHTKTEDLDVLYALPVIFNLKEYFGKALFLVKDQDKLRLTTTPDKGVLTANRAIPVIGGVRSLVPPGYDDEDADMLMRLFMEQYKNTKHIRQTRQLQQHVKEMRRQS